MDVAGQLERLTHASLSAWVGRCPFAFKVHQMQAANAFSYHIPEATVATIGFSKL